MRTATTLFGFLPLFVFSVQPLAAAPAPAKAVDYSRDIRPILANACYACHGPDEGKRKGKLRLDLRAAALKKAIKPGDAEHSELIARVTSEDETEIMPPVAAKRGRLSAEQVQMLRRWIDQGARFDIHWAYVKPVRPAIPAVKNTAWPINAIDYFIAAGHEKNGFTPAPDADPVTLLRRLSFDLTGLPPTPEDVDRFMAKAHGQGATRLEAYDQAVARLLASEHFGERMALYWLDLVRFADTAGYHSDNHRDITLYRDYVINAFNANMPFDQFTREQLSGDLLPNRNTAQRIASGYNRLLMTTEEGGAQPKEYTAKYAADRVRNVSSVWLAGTMGCCECHNHKFDPFTMKDFYSMAAFFADVQEVAVGRQPQTLLPSPVQAARLKQIENRLNPLKAELARMTPERQKALTQWIAKATADKGKGLSQQVKDILALAPAQRLPRHEQILADNWREHVPELAKTRKELAEAQAEWDRAGAEVPTTLVAMSGPPRTIRILARGNWQDDSGEIVNPAVPGFLPAPEKKGRLTRLDLAQWLVSRDNPLTVRVFVNRLWKLCFGQGLVKSLEDFGSQGSAPSHPELLDYLAVEFMDSGWNVKHLLTLMVTSRTYRQSSVGTRAGRERDPGNAWLARQSRFRLDAEVVRDSALAISGLLSRKVGGPSAKPYQPAGYWAFLNFPKREWVADKGEGQHRRSLYTYWQRTFPHPSLIAFDAPSREECTVDRPRSSTPLQALVLLNDPIYVEAARVFAEHIVRDGGPTPEARLTWAFRRALTRAPRPEEVAPLLALHAKHQAEFHTDKKAAQALLKTGQVSVPGDLDVADMAAWTSVARVLLNLHEAITRN